MAPYQDLLSASSRDAKKDDRIKESGRLIAFDLFGEKWPLEPKTAFYDWVYLNTLAKMTTSQRSSVGMTHLRILSSIQKINKLPSILCGAF